MVRLLFDMQNERLRLTLSKGNIRLASSCLSGNIVITERNHENVICHILMREYVEPYQDVFVM